MRSSICIIVFTVFYYLSGPGADYSGLLRVQFNKTSSCLHDKK